MGFLDDRRRKQREARERKRTKKELSFIRRVNKADFIAGDKHALRFLVVETWNAAPTSTMQLLRQAWASNGGERTGARCTTRSSVATGLASIRRLGRTS